MDLIGHNFDQRFDHGQSNCLPLLKTKEILSELNKTQLRMFYLHSSISRPVIEIVSAINNRMMSYNVKPVKVTSSYGWVNLPGVIVSSNCTAYEEYCYPLKLKNCGFP